MTLVGAGDHKHSFISEADVAAFPLAAVDNPLAYNIRLEIGGPSYSWTELVAMAGEVMGQALPVNYVMPGSEVPLLDPMVGALLTGFETYEDFVDLGGVPAQVGVALTPITAVLQQMFGPH